jgi:hypothetical protein
LRSFGRSGCHDRAWQRHGVVHDPRSVIFADHPQYSKTVQYTHCATRGVHGNDRAECWRQCCKISWIKDGYAWRQYCAVHPAVHDMRCTIMRPTYDEHVGACKRHAETDLKLTGALPGTPTTAYTVPPTLRSRCDSEMDVAPTARPFAVAHWGRCQPRSTLVRCTAPAEQMTISPLAGATAATCASLATSRAPNPCKCSNQVDISNDAHVVYCGPHP